MPVSSRRLPLLLSAAAGIAILLFFLFRPAPPPPATYEDPLEDSVMDLERFLVDFAAQVRHQASGGAAYHVAPDFEGTVFLCDPKGAATTFNGVRVVEGPPEVEAEVEGEGFAAEIGRLELAAITLKVPSAEMKGEVLEAALRIDALGIEGRMAKRWVGDAKAEFIRPSGRWLFSRYRLERVRTEQGMLRFLDVTAASGLKVKAGYDPRPDAAGLASAYQFQGGIAAGDYDGDGDVDLYVPRIGRNAFFRNDGARFARIDQAADEDAGSSALFLDVDNDGDLDLLVTNYEPNARRALALFRNDGGRFTDVTDAAGLTGVGPAMSAVAADVEGDGDLDLYVCLYRGIGGTEENPQIPIPSIIYDARNGEPNQLWINRGDGTFVEEASSRGVDDAGWGLAAGFADYDDDGDPDLYLANDYGDNKLFRNRGDGTFEDVTVAAGTGDTGFGMGVLWIDFDRDGDLDLYVSNMYTTAGNRILSRESGDDVQRTLRKMASGNTLFRNEGDGTFKDVTKEVGGGKAGWAWSAAEVDYDNDARPDIYVTNGFRTSPVGTSDL